MLNNLENDNKLSEYSDTERQKLKEKYKEFIEKHKKHLT